MNPSSVRFGKRRTKSCSSSSSMNSTLNSINQTTELLLCFRLTQVRSVGNLRLGEVCRNANFDEGPFKRLRKTIPFLADLKQIQGPDEALSLFREYRQKGFTHDYPSYSALIYRLARSRNFEDVESLLGQILDGNIRCKESLFMALMQHYGKFNLVEKAIELFHRIPSFNCARTLQSFNSLLDILVDNDRMSDANTFFNQCRKMGFRPNCVSFNIIIKGHLKRGEWEIACNVFEEMLQREVQPTVVTYNSLLGFLCKRGDFDSAQALFDDMIKKKKYPNAVTYALLMECLCSSGKYKEAKNLMFDMEYRGCKAQLLNYGVLMSDLGKKGKIEEAKSLLGEMKKRRYKPDVVTYNILINCHCREGRADDAYKILIDMQIAGCEPNAATYRIMLDGFCQIKDFSSGLKILNAMLASRHWPREQSFVCLASGLLMSGEIGKARFVLEEMERREMRLDIEAWETLMEGVCVGDDATANELLTELISPEQ